MRDKHIGISKSRYTLFRQCPKALWLKTYRPEEADVSDALQQRFEAGDAVGDLAMGLFGEFTKVTAYTSEGRLDLVKMAEDTKKCMEAGVEVICEAAFCNYNNYCAADILRKTETGYDLYEVKDAREVSPQHIKDAGFQYYIISRCKLKIGKIFIVIHGQDQDNPFVPVEVTRQAKGYYRWINDHIWDLNRRQKEPEEIEVEPGDQCLHPYQCWYYEYCHEK